MQWESGSNSNRQREAAAGSAAGAGAAGAAIAAARPSGVVGARLLGSAVSAGPGASETLGPAGAGDGEESSGTDW